MVEIGKLNKLRIVKEVDFGLYLDGGDMGEILLPLRYVPQKFEINDILEVFIYKDSEDRIIATTEIPLVMAGEFALLETVAVDRIGAFVNWGLMKDLLVPFSEQQVRMEKGKKYIIRVFLDEVTLRLAGSGRIEKFLDKSPSDLNVGDEVDILIANQTDLGFKVIINNKYSGVLYKNEIFQRIDRGQRLKAYISKIRDDKKIDVCLNKPGIEKIDILSNRLIKLLHENNGFLALNDKSNSEDIYLLLKESKKTFKKAIGALYKMKKILIEENGIRLNTVKK
jgi:predicted RNA-binding protein (virulence factor B family)